MERQRKKERERERGRVSDIYIYIYIERETETEDQSKRIIHSNLTIVERNLDICYSQQNLKCVRQDKIISIDR